MALSLLPTPSLAQSSSSVSIEPAFQDLVITEDTPTVTTSFRLINNTDKTQEFTLVPIDIKQTDAQGNIVFVDKPTGNAYTLASFIKVPSESIQIAPGEKKQVTVTIVNSQDISPGGHYGAVIARFVTSEGQGNQKILPAVSSLLFIRKTGGERFHLSLQEVSFGTHAFATNIPKDITLLFENQGNTHVIPRGEIQLSDLFGNVIYEGTINEGSTPVLPQITRNIKVNLRLIRKTLPLQFYTLTIKGRSVPGDIAFSQQQSFIYISRTMLIVLSAIVLVGVGMTVFMIKKNTKKIQSS